MSASQDKRKRSAGGSGFGTGKGKKSKKDKTMMAAIITPIVVAVLFAAALFINSDFLRQNFAAVKVDDTKYSVIDFNYYYENAYAQYYNAMSGAGSFGQDMLPEQNQSLKSQIYDPDTGETWADFFKKMALDQIKEDNKIYRAALAAGFKLPDEQKKKLDDDFNTMKQNALASGYSDFGVYLKSIFGKGMTEAAYLKNAERSYLINAYANNVRDSFKYSAADLESYYKENKDNFDTYTYRYFLVSSADLKETDYPDEAAYNIANAAAVEATVEKANAYASTIKSEQNFIDAARQYDPETNKEDSATLRIYQGNLLGSVYGPWMKDAARKSGEVTTIKTTTGCYVVYYMERSDNHYPTVDMRQILVRPESIDKEQYSGEKNDDAYNAAVAKAKQTAKDTADKIYDEWSKNGFTEDQLTTLTTSYAKEISAEDSKQIKEIFKTQLTKEVNDWLFDPSRKAGDHTQLYNADNGYYIVYFEGQGKQYSDALADKAKRDKDQLAWKDSLTGSEPQTTWLMTMTA